MLRKYTPKNPFEIHLLTFILKYLLFSYWTNKFFSKTNK